MKSNQLLMIDADPVFIDYLKKDLTPEGFQIHLAKDAQQGLKHAFNKSYHAILVDLNLPGEHGLAFVKKIREQCDTPIIVITASHDDIDRIMALELGADVYMTKPLSTLELIAELHALLRRTQQKGLHRSVLISHNITLDIAKRLVTVAGNLLVLTNAEFNILETLMKFPNQAFTKEELTEYALGRKYTAYDRSIDVHVSNLRNKLGHHPTGDSWIKTVRGFGYLFNG